MIPHFAYEAVSVIEIRGVYLRWWRCFSVITHICAGVCALPILFRMFSGAAIRTSRDSTSTIPRTSAHLTLVLSVKFSTTNDYKSILGKL